MREKSLAWTMLEEAKKTNKRIFVVLIIVLFMWFATIGYLVYLLNDIGTIENTQEITDFESIENSDIVNGDYYGED